MAKPSEPKWVLMIPFITAPGFPLEESRTVTIGGLQRKCDRPVSTIRKLRSTESNQHEQLTTYSRLCE